MKMNRTIIGTIVTLMMLFISACSLNSKNVPKELVLAKETDHAIFYVRKTDDEIESMIDILSEEFENQYDRLVEMFQFAPPNKQIIYIYTDKGQFREMIGRDTEGTYDANDKIIKVYTPSDLSDRIVRKEYSDQVVHEFVHAVIQQLNPDVGGIKWLDEGTAVYVTKQLEADIHSGRYVNQPLPDISNFESPTYFDEAGGVAYYFSGLLVQYMIEQFGLEKFNQFLRDPLDMENILDLPVESLFIGWIDYVNHLYN